MKISNLSASIMVDAFGVLFDDGTVQIYDGSQPATVDTAIGTQNLLATLTLPADAFPPATNGVVTLAAVTPVFATGTGKATWARWFDGATALMDTSIALTGADMSINDINVANGNQVEITGLTFTQPKG